MILNTNLGDVDTDSLSYRVGLEQGLAVGAITGGVNTVNGAAILSHSFINLLGDDFVDSTNDTSQKSVKADGAILIDGERGYDLLQIKY